MATTVETRSTAERPPHFDGIDGVYAALRAAAVVVGALFVLLSPDAAAVQTELTIAFGAFTAYTALAYAAGYPLFQTRLKSRFYTTTAAIDFVFVLVLMLLTDGADGPMYRAMYVWVAMLAFYFGQRGGNWASAVAFVAFAWFFWADAEGDAFQLLVKSGGLLLHGPVIGWLVDRERRREKELRDALAQLERSRRQMRE